VTTLKWKQSEFRNNFLKQKVISIPNYRSWLQLPKNVYFVGSGWNIYCDIDILSLITILIKPLNFPGRFFLIISSVSVNTIFDIETKLKYKISNIKLMIENFKQFSALKLLIFKKNQQITNYFMILVLLCWYLSFYFNFYFKPNS
jgi:hypothetical protein